MTAEATAITGAKKLAKEHSLDWPEIIFLNENQVSCKGSKKLLDFKIMCQKVKKRRSYRNRHLFIVWKIKNTLDYNKLMRLWQSN
jgi:hypothetical protein